MPDLNDLAVVPRDLLMRLCGCGLAVVKLMVVQNPMAATTRQDFLTALNAVLGHLHGVNSKQT